MIPAMGTLMGTATEAAADVLVLLRELLSLLGTRSRISGHGCEISEKIKGACCCQVRITGIKGCTVSTPSPKVSATSAEVKGWKLGTSSTKRKGPTLSRAYKTGPLHSKVKRSQTYLQAKDLIHLWLIRKSLVNGKEMQEWQKGGSGNRINWNKDVR